MTLRTKSAITVGFVLLACAALILGMAYVLVSAGIQLTAANAARETDAAREAEVGRALDAVLRILAEDTDAMAGRVAIWARRDDTYAYVESRSAAWRRANLPDTLCPELGLSVIVMVDATGRVVDRLSYDLDRRTFGDLPAGVLAALAPGQPLVAPNDATSARSGVLLLPEGPMLAAAAAILPRSGAGPARGAFVMGRFLTPGQIALIGERAGASVRLYPASAADLPADVRTALDAGGTPGVRRTADGTYAGHALVRDVAGAPALVARVTARVDAAAPAAAALAAVERQASAATLWLAVVLVGSLLIAFGAVLLIQESTLFRRTGALTARLEEIAAGAAQSARVEARGDDELSRLENAVNEALAAVENAGRLAMEREKALSASLEHCRLGLQATGQLMFDVDVQAGRIAFEGAVTRVTGHTPEELRSVPLSTWEAMVHPDDRQAAVAAGEQAASTGTAYRIEYRLKRKDGSWVTVEDRGVRVPGDSPRIVGTIRVAPQRHPPEQSAPTA